MVVQLGSDILSLFVLPLLDPKSLLSLWATNRFLNELVETQAKWDERYAEEFFDDQDNPTLKPLSNVSRYMRRSNARIYVWDPTDPQYVVEFRPNDKAVSEAVWTTSTSFRDIAGLSSMGCVLVGDKVAQLEMSSPKGLKENAKLVLHSSEIGELGTGNAPDAPILKIGGNSSYIWGLDTTNRVHGMHVGFWRAPYQLKFDANYDIEDVQGLVLQSKGVLKVKNRGLVVFRAENPRVDQDTSDGKQFRHAQTKKIPGAYFEPGDPSADRVVDYACGLEYVVFVTESGKPYFFDVPSALDDMAERKSKLLEDAISLVQEDSKFVRVRAQMGSLGLITDRGEAVVYSTWDLSMSPIEPELLKLDLPVADLTLSSYDPIAFTEAGISVVPKKRATDTEETEAMKAARAPTIIPEYLNGSIVKLHRSHDFAVALALAGVDAGPDAQLERRELVVPEPAAAAA